MGKIINEDEFLNALLDLNDYFNNKGYNCIERLVILRALIDYLITAFSSSIIENGKGDLNKGAV